MHKHPFLQMFQIMVKRGGQRLWNSIYKTKMKLFNLLLDRIRKCNIIILHLEIQDKHYN